MNPSQKKITPEEIIVLLIKCKNMTTIKVIEAQAREL